MSCYSTAQSGCTVASEARLDLLAARNCRLLLYKDCGTAVRKFWMQLRVYIILALNVRSVSKVRTYEIKMGSICAFIVIIKI